MKKTDHDQLLDLALAFIKRQHNQSAFIPAAETGHVLTTDDDRGFATCPHAECQLANRVLTSVPA